MSLRGVAKVSCFGGSERNYTVVLHPSPDSGFKIRYSERLPFCSDLYPISTH